MTKSVVMLCDWLPPDFGAVGQYDLPRARAMAAAGQRVTLIGLSSTGASTTQERIGAGTLTIRRLHRPPYDRSQWRRRLGWTAITNLALVRAAAGGLRGADELRITGSPPLLLHFAMPLAKLMRKPVSYRITDFHPECLMVAMPRVPAWLHALQRLTLFWRRRVARFEVLAEDQRRRLHDCGIDPARIDLVRDGSPVTFKPETRAAQQPRELTGRQAVLYSGNWGVAHDDRTFADGLAAFERKHPGVAALWLNAIGQGADTVERSLRENGAHVHRSRPVPLDSLASLLLAADVHLITLRDAFVGYVLPSKTYACIASGRPVLFIGSADSDVHLLCTRALPPQRYRRVDVGDAAGVVSALEALLPDRCSLQPRAVEALSGIAQP